MKIKIIVVAICILYAGASAWIANTIPSFESRFETDSYAYVERADRFTEHGSFEKPGVTIATHWFGAGYSLFLACTYYLKSFFVPSLHSQSSAHEKYNLAVILQILFGLCLILLGFRLGSLFFSPEVGCLTATLAACNIGLLTYPQYILSETLIATLLLFAFERFIIFLQTRSTTSLALSGFVFGSSLIIKAAAWYYLGFLLVLLIWFCLHRKIRLIKTLGCFVLFISLPLGSYMFYNKRTYGHFFFKAVDKVNIYYHFLPKLISTADGVTFEQARNQVAKDVTVKEYASGKGWEHAHILLQRYLLSNPITAFGIAAFNVTKTFFGLYSTHFKMLFVRTRTILKDHRSFFQPDLPWSQRLDLYLHRYATTWWLKCVSWYEIFYLLLIYMFAGLAAFILLIKRNFFTLIILGSFIGYCASITFPDGCGRLRFIFEVPLLVTAAQGIFLLMRPKSGYHTPRKGAVGP